MSIKNYSGLVLCTHSTHSTANHSLSFKKESNTKKALVWCFALTALIQLLIIHFHSRKKVTQRKLIKLSISQLFADWRFYYRCRHSDD